MRVIKFIIILGIGILLTLLNFAFGLIGPTRDLKMEWAGTECIVTLTNGESVETWKGTSHISPGPGPSCDLGAYMGKVYLTIHGVQDNKSYIGEYQISRGRSYTPDKTEALVSFYIPSSFRGWQGVSGKVNIISWPVDELDMNNLKIISNIKVLSKLSI